MADPNTPNPASPQTPDAGTASPEAIELERLRREVLELKARDGRYRNEKGVMQARIRELEQIVMSDDTGNPDPNTAPPDTSGYGYPPYRPQPPFYPQPQMPEIVTREEWDMDRFKRENPDRFDAVRKIALDSSRLPEFIRYRQNANGQAVPDVYGTYKAISQYMELEDLRKATARNDPNRNPAAATISGNSASDMETVEIPEDLTPEQIVEKFPEHFQKPTTKGWLKEPT